MVVTRLPALAIAVALALTPACGGDDGAPEHPAAPMTEETTTAAEEPTGPQPAIVVETPKQGDEVSSPVEVAGTADVFEANVTVRLLDRTGDEISRGFTTATCGTGCRGDFSTQVVFRVPAKQRGTLVVSDEDADGDGKPQHEARIAVTLLPSRS
jgi:hypothetical protein